MNRTLKKTNDPLNKENKNYAFGGARNGTKIIVRAHTRWPALIYIVSVAQPCFFFVLCFVGKMHFALQVLFMSNILPK